MSIAPLTQPDNPVTPILNRYRASMMTFEQLQDVPDPDWLIDGILLENSVGVLWGDSGGGKSFVAIDWAMSIACAKAEWFGHNVKPGKVLYVVGEGRQGIKKRANAWVRQRNAFPEDEEIVFMGHMVDIIEPDSFAATKQIIAEFEPDLVVVDTLARAFTGHNENDTTDMGRFVSAAEVIKEEFNTSVLLIHHPNAGAFRKMRGNGALKGAIDFEYELEVSDADDFMSQRILWCRKMKDAPKPKPKSLYLKEIPSAESLVLTESQYDHVY